MKNILIVGLGSIGRRHVDNFGKYFDEIDIVDINPDRIKQAQEEFKINNAYSDYLKPIRENNYVAVAITTPPHLHLPIALEASKNGSHLFIEKPLGMSISGWEEVNQVCEKNNIVSYIAFCHRHINFSKRLKEIVDSKVIGTPIHANMRWGSYLPDWHPYEDYRTFYMAKKEEGGGALMDESHGIDFVRYILGDVKEVFGVVDNITNLEISSDDVAFLTLRMNSNALVHINFDLQSRAPRVNFEIICDEGTVIWDRIKNRIEIYSSKNKKWSLEQYTQEDTMSMYPNQASHFIDCIKNDKKPFININDGMKTQRVIDATFESSNLKRIISI